MASAMSRFLKGSKLMRQFGYEVAEEFVQGGGSVVFSDMLAGRKTDWIEVLEAAGLEAFAGVFFVGPAAAANLSARKRRSERKQNTREARKDLSARGLSQRQVTQVVADLQDPDVEDFQMPIGENVMTPEARLEDNYSRKDVQDRVEDMSATQRDNLESYLMELIEEGDLTAEQEHRARESLEIARSYSDQESVEDQIARIQEDTSDQSQEVEMEIVGESSAVSVTGETSEAGDVVEIDPVVVQAAARQQVEPGDAAPTTTEAAEAAETEADVEQAASPPVFESKEQMAEDLKSRALACSFALPLASACFSSSRAIFVFNRS